MALKIVIGGDNAGFNYKEALRKDLEADDRVASVEDVGVGGVDDTTSYPNVAVAAAEKVARGEADRALLICGTGLGVAIAANKVKGIRAVTAQTCTPCSGPSCRTMRRCCAWANASWDSSWRAPW